MIDTAYLCNSHRWLYDRLAEGKSAVAAVEWVPERRDASLVIYPSPPAPDPEAPETIRRLGVGALTRAFVFSVHDAPVAWAPGLYASLPRSRACDGLQRGGFYVPHHHWEPGGLGPRIEVAREATPDLLWTFAGTVANAPRLRGAIVRLADERGIAIDTATWDQEIRWHWTGTKRKEGDRAFGDYAAVLGRSKFVLCPRGVGPSSMRIFESLQAGRVPVILSDDWLRPPFVDWASCAVFVPEDQVDRLPDILREREAEAAEMGRLARAAWERWFAPGRMLATIVDAALEMASASAGRRVRVTLAVRGVTSRAALSVAKSRLRRLSARV